MYCKKNPKNFNNLIKMFTKVKYKLIIRIHFEYFSIISRNQLDKEQLGTKKEIGFLGLQNRF